MYAVTSHVWLFDSHFNHVRPQTVEEAVDLAHAGNTVVMQTLDDARAVLIGLGSPEEDADYRIAQTQKRIDSGIHD